MPLRTRPSPLALIAALAAAGCAARNSDGGTSSFDFGAPTGGVLGIDAARLPADAMVIGGARPPAGDASASGGQPSPGGAEPPPPPPPDPDAGAGGVPVMQDPGPCGARAPDAHGACPATIYEVRREIGLGNKVTVRGVVTSIRAANDGTPRNVTLQIGFEQPEYFGADYSAVWLYLGDATAPAEAVAGVQRGQLLEVTGVTNDFHGQRQITAIEVVAPAGNGGELVPLPVAPADVATGGPRADALEAALIEVLDVTVANGAPAPGEGDREPTNEVELDGGLRLDDFLYRLDPLPAAGEAFPRIDGVLRLSNNLLKIEPRDPADVDRPHAPPPAADLGVPPPPADMGAPPPAVDLGVPPAPGGPLLVSEIDYDQDSTDTAEFVEIHNPGDAPVALAGLQLELVNGADSMVYRRFDLTLAAPSLAAHGFLVVGALAVTQALPAGTPSIAFGQNAGSNSSQMQNGPDGVRIVDAAGRVLDGVAYEGAIPGTGEGDPTTGDPGNPEGDSLSRCLNAPDTNNNANDFQVLPPTPGATQSCR